MSHDHGAQAAQDHDDTDFFEPAGWEERYAGDATMWSGRANPQLVTEASSLTPGTALDLGCGEGGDVVWLAGRGWRVTGADFAAHGLARAASHAERAGVAEACDWWQVDARTFDAGGRTWDLVTTHFLHPPEAGMVDVTARLAAAVAPSGHLLVVGHAPSPLFTQLDERRANAMWHAADLVGSLPEDFEVLVAEERARTVERDGVTHDIEDATLLARRRP